MNAFASDYWNDDDDSLFYDEDARYDEYGLTRLDDLIKQFSRNAKIVEVIDTGCDAHLTGLIAKNNTKKISKLNNSRDSKPKKKTEIGEKVARRNGGDNREYRDNENSNLSPNEDDESSKKNSLDGLAVSSITFNIVDREINGDDEDFEDFENVYEIESRELRGKKRLISRAVDSDSLSNTSRCSMDENSSVSSTIDNVRRKNIKVRTQELPLSKSSKTKKLTKSHESVDDKVHSANNSRTKNNRWSRRNKLSCTVQSSEDKANIRPKINLPQVERKLGSISRTIIKEKKIKSPKERSGIPRPVARVFSKRENRLTKKPSFNGSKLPVWQGNKKSKISSNFNNSIRIKIVESNNEVSSAYSHRAKLANDNYSDEEIKKIDKNRKNGVGTDAEESKNVSGKFSQFGESPELQRVTFQREEFKEGLEAKSTEETEGDVEEKSTEGLFRAQSSADAKEVADNNDERKKRVEDQSKSDLWSHNYEEAYAKGRAVGLKVYRMAKAAREERKREFRKYGFEDYMKKPRDKPYEIVDIGVSLVEKLIDDRTENYSKRNSVNMRDIINPKHFISQLNFR